MTALPVALTIAVVAVLVTGCGGSDETSHEQKVHQAAKEIRSIDRQERTLVELRVLTSEGEAHGIPQGDELETIGFLEDSWQHQRSRLLHSSTSNQIDEACEEVSESAFCKERKGLGETPLTRLRP
jgi:hypothetical protein